MADLKPSEDVTPDPVELEIVHVSGMFVRNMATHSPSPQVCHPVATCHVPPPPLPGRQPKVCHPVATRCATPLPSPIAHRQKGSPNYWLELLAVGHAECITSPLNDKETAIDGKTADSLFEWIFR